MAELTDEQIAQEEKFLEGLPRVNIGALVMPGIWGPAHGFWACILFYPLMIFIDYVVYGAYIKPEAWTIALAVIGVALYIVAYLKRERIWAVVCVIILIIALAWATYYNLEIRTVLK